MGEILNGNVLNALDQIEIALGQTKNEDLESLKEDALILKECSKLEAGLYATAILTLSELINRHIVEHKNYIFSEKKSILEHPHPQRLVDQYAGKGIKITNQQPGVPGYQEIVNFQEFIGMEFRNKSIMQKMECILYLRGLDS